MTKTIVSGEDVLFLKQTAWAAESIRNRSTPERYPEYNAVADVMEKLPKGEPQPPVSLDVADIAAFASLLEWLEGRLGRGVANSIPYVKKTRQLLGLVL